jgi:hypothetical protein
MLQSTLNGEKMAVRIEVRKNGMTTAVIITFHTKTDKFESDYDRSKFFRELYGWNQTVPKNDKKYLYRRDGVLDEVPHIRVAESAFIVAIENMKRMTQFFDQWQGKVEFDTVEVMLKKKILQDIERLRSGSL